MPAGSRALVVGAGIMGLCTAWALKRDGWDVRILEQDEVPNPRGSSVDDHRSIRHAYGRERGYMRMVDEAYAGWHLLWADLGTTLYVNTGVLAFSTDATAWIRDSIATLREDGRPVKVLAPAEIASLCPMLTVPDGASALLLDRGGLLLAERIVAALGRHLSSHIERRRVVDVAPARAAVRCDDGREHGADLLVLAAGPSGPALLPTLTERVTPSRQVVAYYQPPDAQAAHWAAAPAVIDLSAESGFWAFPPVAGTGLKMGDHSFSMTGDPDAPRVVTQQDLDAIATLCRQRVVDFDRYRLIRAKVCYYDVTAEERFVIEKPAPQCWVLSGFSGHGFKFGACIGLRLAQAATDTAAAAALPAWAAGR